MTNARGSLVQAGLMHMEGDAPATKKISQINFSPVRRKYKYLILLIYFFAFDLGNLLKAASSLAESLSRATCPQSYPQDLWIGQKIPLKPIVSSVFQELH
ncbi:hypothetical protein [Herbaspirillum sp.]|uniref:hypothetical protein n=1 Tax=Herbaspirillum sp. TaxID=1890675 RepID=UPI0031E2FB32